jgi:hypothetical protein
LESARVEVAVLLNDLAYLKYEASKDTSTTVETILLKQRNVAIAFSLVERVIKLTSTMDEVEGKQKLICYHVSYNALIDVKNFQISSIFGICLAGWEIITNTSEFCINFSLMDVIFALSTLFLNSMYAYVMTLSYSHS